MNKELKASALALTLFASPAINNISDAKAAEIKITGEGRVDCTADNDSHASIGEQILPGSSIRIGQEPHTLKLENINGALAVFSRDNAKLFNFEEKRNRPAEMPKGVVFISDSFKFSDGTYAYAISPYSLSKTKEESGSAKVTIGIRCNTAE